MKYKVKYNLHHLVPKSIGGIDSDGRKYLCKKCHDILHNMLIKQLWKYIPIEKQMNTKNQIKAFSLWWIFK